MPSPTTSCRNCDRNFSEAIPKQAGRNFCVECWVQLNKARRPPAEQRKEETRRYYEKNQKALNAKSRAHYAANKDHLLGYAKEYRDKNRDKIAAQRASRRSVSVVVTRRWFWVTKYGLSIEQAEKMLQDQQNVCAICLEANANGRHLAVDHCHATGRVRGFLCSNCNIALGNFRDDPVRMQRAIQYLISANIRSQT